VKIKTYKTEKFPVVLYGSGTWSLSVKEERRVLQSGVARRIFGPKREKIIGGWERLDNEEPHNLHSSPKIIRFIKKRRMG
jgi:hypothetical protein